MYNKTKRLFNATYSRNENETGIGIEEIKDNMTIVIHSIFIDEKLSNRESMQHILYYINDLLENSEFARVQSDLFKISKGVHNAFNEKIKVKFKSYKTGLMSDVKDLSQDALNRKTTIKEIF